MRIGTALRRDKILKPRAYTSKETGSKYSNERDVKYPYDWSPKTITTIIQNQAYLGHLVFYKATTKSFKSKKLVANDESEWIIAKNTHEPLVDEQTFEQAQKITVIKRRTCTGEPHIFAGLIRCPDCGKAMHPLKRTDRTYTASYSCNTYSRYGKKYCTMHYIRYDTLYDIVFNDIRRCAKLAQTDENAFWETLNKSEIGKAKLRLSQYENEMDIAEKRLSEIGIIIKQLYEDSVIGRLSSERFFDMSREYENESTAAKAKIRKFQKEIASCKAVNDNSRQFTSLSKKYVDITELNASMLNELITKIEVHEREIFNGSRMQKVDIYFNFVGSIG